MLSAPTMAQIAAIEALRNGESDVEKMVQEYNRRRRFMVKRLNEIGLPCFEPKGAFFAFPSIKGTGMNSEEFAEKLLLSRALPSDHAVKVLSVAAMLLRYLILRKR